jgi:hypothetical protein
MFPLMAIFTINTVSSPDKVRGYASIPKTYTNPPFVATTVNLSPHSTILDVKSIVDCTKVGEQVSSNSPGALLPHVCNLPSLVTHAA